ncbi:MAG: peptide chain release factor N(5)-glutamine methyltransferase [Saprospiraceae bacterium]|nr:peptide chain release factor N(5)-glutamine methyltransferase [Saprospiraceae bacterium]
MENGDDLFQHILVNLNDDFDSFEKRAIAKTILYYIAHFTMPWFTETNISEELVFNINHLISRINAGEPTQYVCGLAPFRNYLLNVDENVLIPRPETEELVSLVLANLPVLPAGKGIDIGTGSGAIALSIALESKREMNAMDISEGALQMAMSNIEKYSASVNLIHSDILNSPLPENYSFIVSNPPYIPVMDKIDMLDSVLKYEPGVALFVPDDSPLLFYQRIVALSTKSIIPRGGLFFECHPIFISGVADLLKVNGFDNVQILSDLSGKQRMVQGFMPR